VRGEGAERVPIRAGQAAFWEPGERHEAGTEVGMTAIVVETEALGGEPMAIGPMPPTGEADVNGMFGKPEHQQQATAVSGSVMISTPAATHVLPGQRRSGPGSLPVARPGGR
jgi:hypothetical protein